MKILNIGNLPFNDDLGLAEIIRTNFIIKGLEENNNTVETYSYSNNYNRDILKTDSYKKQTKFYYLFQRKNKLYLFRLIYFFIINPFKLFFKIVQKAPQFDIILLDTLPITFVLPVIIAIYIRHKKYIFQINEFIGGPLLRESFIDKVNFNMIKYSIIFLLKNASGVIVISSEHEKYYRKYTKVDCKFTVIPMLMDFTKNIQKSNILKNKIITIGYGGTLNISNGINLLINAVEILIKQKVTTRLVLFGPSLPAYRTKLINDVTNKKLEKYIIILPQKTNKDTIEFINNEIDILVIPKLNDYRSRGYIPSKLGDYLYSGKLVVVTNVGEMSFYIKDGENGYIVESDNTELLATKLKYIIQNYETAQKIGIVGRETSKEFDYRKQISKLLAIIEQIK